MSKATITSVPATPTPETSGNSASLASTPFQLDGAERETRRYNPIEFLAWVRTIIKYSEIRGGESSLFPASLGQQILWQGVCFGARTHKVSVGLFDVAGIMSCWQDYVLDAFHVELEAMKADGDLHSYGLDKPETLANIKEGEYISQVPLHTHRMLVLTNYEQKFSRKLRLSSVRTSTQNSLSEGRSMRGGLRELTLPPLLPPSQRQRRRDCVVALLWCTSGRINLKPLLARGQGQRRARRARPCKGLRVSLL